MDYEILANGNLKLTLEGEEDREEVREMLEKATHKDHGFLADLLEYTKWQPNGELHQVSPEELGALTDAPILTDDVTYEDDTDKRLIIGKVWWYPEYQVLSFAEELLKHGEVVFTLAPADETQSETPQEAVAH